ncbi:MAG: hypothetical protein OXE73_13130 [Gammaproteobacteria bacterium]|nr:hypothetical protein [Gammaproteobacteria bacterium]
MSRSIATALAVLLIPASATALSAQNPTDFAAVLGAWEMTLETPRGSITQTLTFAAEGDQLEGTLTAPNGSVELQEVAFQDGTLTFRVTRNMRNRQIAQSFTATIDGDQMTGTISGGRGGGREFTAMRSTT